MERRLRWMGGVWLGVSYKERKGAEGCRVGIPSWWRKACMRQITTKIFPLLEWVPQYRMKGHGIL
jgi:hypothetical protein